MQAPDTNGETPSARPTFTLSEAAEVAGVSRITIRRYLDKGKFPNAVQVGPTKGKGNGTWRIGVDDLLSAGLKLNAPSPPDAPAAKPAAAAAPANGAEVDELRRELAQERERRIRAEADRDAQREVVEVLRDQVTTMKALMPGPAPARRRFFSRRV